jgi:hypothetical protein
MSVSQSGSKVVLELNATLSSGESAFEAFTPEDGKHVYVSDFHVELPFSADVASCICWDSVSVWNIRESGSMPFIKDIGTGDGVKQFKVMLQNINASSPQPLSAYVVLDVR